MRALLDLIFPPSCLACGARGHVFLCPGCATAFPWVRERCERCGRPSARSVRDCGDCRALTPAFREARAAAIYTGVARDVLMSFKLGGERRAAPAIAETMARAAPDLRADIVTWVPATKRSRAARGFDPAEALARSVAPRLGTPARALLRKVRATADQAGLGRAERRCNLSGAFAGRRAAGTVMLVDDVMTTGATADECAKVLRAAGAAAVVVLTFARAP